MRFIQLVFFIVLHFTKKQKLNNNNLQGLFQANVKNVEYIKEIPQF